MKKWLFSAGLVLLLMAMGCAPKAPVAPPVTPAPTPVATPAVQAITPEEAAWARVVEAAKKEGKLVSYSFRMIGETGIRMKQAFKERTGLDVEFITSTGAVMIERIKVERRGGFQVASTLDTANVLLLQAKMEGLTEAAGPLLELLNKEAWKGNPILDKEGHILVSGVVLYSPWVNTRLVKPGEEPKSWRELLQPRWKGKMGVSDPDTDPLSIQVYYQLVKKHGILDDAYFRELGKVLVLQPTARMTADAVVRGEVDITLVSNASNMAPFLREGAPVKAIDMEEGLVATQSLAYTFLSQAPHPNAARVYINWLFSQEGQLTFHKVNGTESLRQNVPNFTPAPGRLTPKKVLWASVEDDIEVAKIQRARAFKNLLLGK